VIKGENRKPGHAAQRRFRVSRNESFYFITANVAHRGSGLEQPAVTARILAEWIRLDADQTWSVLTGVVMPDHVHLLVRLGHGRTLAEAMRLFRGRLAPVLRAHGLGWQAAFYEHRLRGADDITPAIIYIFLNPYRAGLLLRNEAWPGYYCRTEEWAWFGGITANSAPQPEWLG